MNTLASGDQNRATISDVARVAGVSIKTVSRVANGEPNVREQTRDKVLAVIAALGYQANPYARYLSSLRRPGGARAPAVPATDREDAKKEIAGSRSG